MAQTRRRRKSKLEVRVAQIVSRRVSRLIDLVAREVRRTMASEIQDYLGGAIKDGGRALAPTPRRRILPCIAPGCGNPSKGPRFHYLCEQHRDASRKDYEAWRKASRPAA